MSDAISVWREAIKDETHPRYKAAWLLFTETMNLNYAARQLEAQREQVIEWLFEILDTPDLYDTGSFGNGWSPVHAVQLLGHWQVESAIPYLIRFLKEEDPETYLYDETIQALEKFGAVILDPLFELDQDVSDQVDRSVIASIMADAAPNDSRVYPHLETLLQELEDEWDIEFVVESLLHVDKDRAIPFLERLLSKGKYPSDLRTHINNLIQDARDGTSN